MDDYSSDQWASEKIRWLLASCATWAAHEMERQSAELALRAAELRQAVLR